MEQALRGKARKQAGGWENAKKIHSRSCSKGWEKDWENVANPAVAREEDNV